MLKKSTLLFIGTFFLLFMGLNSHSYGCHKLLADGFTPRPHGPNDDCSGNGDEDTTSGTKDFALRLTFDAYAVDRKCVDNICSDINASYVDNEGAGVEAGERSQPNPTAGITLGLRARPRIERQLFLDITCNPIPEVGNHSEIDNCNQLPAELGDVLLPECEGNDFCNLGASVRPYKVNCPDGTPCRDVFTMAPNTTKLMSFRLGLGGGLTVEVASNIDAGGALDPGRCLSLHPDPPALAEALCPAVNNGTDCNVRVTAYNDNRGGENDEWDVDAIGVTALLCIRGTSTSTLLGKATLTFGFHAIKKE